MLNRKQIIAITVLGLVARMLGCKPNAKQIGNVASEPTVKLTRELTSEEKKIVGTYEYMSNDTYRLVFQKNGIMKGYDYRGGDKEHTWSIVGNEIHTDYRLLENGKRMTGTILSVTAYRIDQDHMDILVNSITKITTIEDGKREDLSKFHQFTDKNIRQLTSEENIIVGTYEQKQMILV